MRSNFCGELNKTNLNEEVILCGWVNRRRDHGGVIFLDLRDKKGLAQIVINPETADTFKSDFFRGFHRVELKWNGFRCI